ncbi:MULTISPECIES: hypothetical protein [Xanthomonas]|uniref:hypothetical protein n=1 Tax=Xanthomonas TaxID=338 RepID=UPI001C47BAA7|nr:hypothetical protein [Xanthomonas euvesicatoria]MBV6804192.1 hypothetical protein [Xanthomonas campestris pv. lawsoniae]MBV6890058.1 hypothetical protein [Xanthomonas campestris pv. spermacoces]
MDVDTDKWNFLEKAHDFRAQLRLFGFVLLADVVLVLSTGTNVWNLRWSTISDRPAALVLVVLAYGALVRIVVPLLLPPLLSVLGLLVEWIQRIPGTAPNRMGAESLTYVTWTEADRWLADAPEGSRRVDVEKQMAEIAEEEMRWDSTVRAGWTAVALVLLGSFVPGATVAAVAHWQKWAPLAVGLFAAIPCAYDLWAGSPSRREVRMPGLAERLYRERHGGPLSNARAKN